MLRIDQLLFCEFVFVFDFRTLNEDPNQQVYPFERSRYSADADDDNDNDRFPFDADIYTEETNDVESDDFYGRTREIIIFAEKGTKFVWLNGRFRYINVCLC